jgi:SSS family solute:Na+ symporter
MAVSTGRKASDMALPHFMANHLPHGVGGLLVAALFAAAMSTIDTSLNSSATITLRDLFRGAVKSGDEKREMRVLRGATIFWGAIGTGAALLITLMESNILDLWWQLSGVFAGGMLGLFLLGLLARRAGGTAALIGVAVGVATILWMSFSKAAWMPPAIRYSLDSLTVTVVGTLTIFGVGLLLSLVLKKGPSAKA